MTGLPDKNSVLTAISAETLIKRSNQPYESVWLK
jgi:hypothetical protein